MPFYRVKRTVLDSSSFGLAQEGDLVEVNDEGRAQSMINDGILEREEMKKNAQYFTKVEQVAEKQVEVVTFEEPVEVKLVTESHPDPAGPDEEGQEKKRSGRPKKED